ncbi:uncharacterized protein LOC143465100 [Clavelina lepadiformis]|uniref:Progonadoliberin n=1 Tax=Clavelina lepadiformis TaxID=159417 RepID=A0ABP0EW81_CLALP
MNGLTVLLLSCTLSCTLSLPLKDKGNDNDNDVAFLLDLLKGGFLDNANLNDQIEDSWPAKVDEEANSQKNDAGKFQNLGYGQIGSYGYRPGSKNIDQQWRNDEKTEEEYAAMDGEDHQLSDNDIAALHNFYKAVVGEDAVQKPVPRQHWSYGMRPGGKRSIPDFDGHAISKRQHWSKGYSPGGKRSFGNTERVKRSGGMKEEVYPVEQPKPNNK